MTGVQRPSTITAAAAETGASTQPAQALLDVAAKGPSATDAQLSAAVQALVASGTGVPAPGPATLTRGSGFWRVIHAPHINRISLLLGTKFSISYTLIPENGAKEASASAWTESRTQEADGAPQFYSNVRYESPMLGSGWLSASGSLLVSGDAAVEIRFDQFWVDSGGGKDDLRPFLTDKTRNAGDKLVTSIGRGAFFEGLAIFPVLHLDAEKGVAVFRFPPLNSDIAVVRE